MAIGQRATGILDFFGDAYNEFKRNQEVAPPTTRLMTPPMASPVDQPTPGPLQRAMGVPETSISSTGQTMGTQYPGGPMTLASTIPQVQAQFSGVPQSGMPTPPQVTTVQDRPDLNQEVIAQQSALGEGQFTPDMLRTGQQTPDISGMDRLAKDAADTVKLMSQNKQVKSDPTFLSKVKDYFGSRENMARLAIAFNSMRLEPDANLAAALREELNDLREQSTTQASQQQIVAYLQSNPEYRKYVAIAQQNPEMAQQIYEAILKAEMPKTFKEEVSAPEMTTDGTYFVRISDGQGNITTKTLTDEQGNPIRGFTPQDRADAEAAAAKTKGQLQTSQKFSEKALEQAGSLGNKIRLYQQALVELDRGANTGPIVNRLIPTVRDATANIESIKNQLGITVINAATFGALSESELRLALDTELPLNLPEDQLRTYLERKIQAQSKLQQAMLEKAYKMASMPYEDYLAEQRRLAEENSKYLTPPDGVPRETWMNMTLDQKKQFEQLGAQ